MHDVYKITRLVTMQICFQVLLLDAIIKNNRETESIVLTDMFS